MSETRRVITLDDLNYLATNPNTTDLQVWFANLPAVTAQRIYLVHEDGDTWYGFIDRQEAYDTASDDQTVYERTVYEYYQVVCVPDLPMPVRTLWMNPGSALPTGAAGDA